MYLKLRGNDNLYQEEDKTFIAKIKIHKYIYIYKCFKIRYIDDLTKKLYLLRLLNIL